jgi:tRNA G37 N-methylase Trm5
MTEEQFIEIKDEYLQNIKSMLLEEGNIQPTITLIADHLEENKPAIVHIPLPEKIANSDKGKQMFVDVMIPEIANKVKNKFNIKAVAWAAEAWMRESHKDDFDPEVDDYKKIPINKEILILSVDTGADIESYVYEIIRMSVSPTGEIVEDIELREMPELANNFATNEGRFSGLYKKFTTV